MAETTQEVEEAPRKGSKLPLLIGLILALAGGGGGFFAVKSGILFGAANEDTAPAETAEPLADLPDVAFIPFDPIVISMTEGGSRRYLRFRAQLEVPAQYERDVQEILPRVVDVLNGFLRALKPADLEGAEALVRLRAQMLRRVQVVTGSGRVRDLLIMEFILN